MQQREKRSIKQQSQISYIFECVMSLFYLAFSVIFLFTDLFEDTVYGMVRLLVGILLGIYGIFRIYRALRKLLTKEE
jgi:membrane protein required for beta-lactamase induction